MGESDKIQIPLPLKGLNTVTPDVDIKSGWAREFTNKALLNGRVWMRPACRSVAFNGGLNPIHWYDPTSQSSGWYAILSDGNIRKVSDGSGATNIGGAPLINATSLKHDSLYLVIGCREPRLATYPFTAWTFTTLSITATGIGSACSHKGRLYVANSNTIEYSTVGATTGTMLGVTSISEFLDGQSIYRMFSLSINPSVTTENVLVIFGSLGRVLVFGGDYPGSSTWQLIAKFDMPEPISNLGFYEIDGDIFVATKKYAYWFRDLFNSGAQTAYKNSPTIPIENIWSSVFWSNNYIQPEVSHTFYEPFFDAIITQCSEKNYGNYQFGTIAEYENEGIYFVYFRKYQAWAVWFSTPIFAPVNIVSISGTDFAIGTGYLCELKDYVYNSSVDIYDSINSISIETSWKTPYYIPDGNLNRLNGTRIFFENSSAYGYIEKIRSIFNYSDYNSLMSWYTQSMVTQVNPAVFSDTNVDLPQQASNQYTTIAGTGGQGGAISLQITFKPRSGSVLNQIQNIYTLLSRLEIGGESF